MMNEGEYRLRHANTLSIFFNIMLSCIAGVYGNTTVELVNGPYAEAGRVEIIRNGVRGTVCSDFWDDKDATVICRMLGYHRGVSYVLAAYGSGVGPILIDDCECNGTEVTIDDCTQTSNQNCRHHEDAGVRCFPTSYIPADTAANLAFSKPTVMSSTRSGNMAEYAVDGNVGSYLYHDHCSQTEAYNQMSWWMVDLHGTFVVDRVVITNRGDADWDTLHSFVIEIFQENPIKCPSSRLEVCLNYTSSPLGRGERRTLRCSTPTRGRFVRVRKWNAGSLTLCEVEIYSVPVNECQFPSRYRNISKTRLISEEFELLTDSTILDCSIHCQKKASCLAFNFNDKTRRCELLTPKFTDTKQTHPDWNYYGSDLC